MNAAATQFLTVPLSEVFRDGIEDDDDDAYVHGGFEITAAGRDAIAAKGIDKC